MKWMRCHKKAVILGHVLCCLFIQIPPWSIMCKVKSGEVFIFFGFHLLNLCTVYSWNPRNTVLKANFVAEEFGGCSIECLTVTWPAVSFVLLLCGFLCLLPDKTCCCCFLEQVQENAASGLQENLCDTCNFGLGYFGLGSSFKCVNDSQEPVLLYLLKRVKKGTKLLKWVTNDSRNLGQQNKLV